MKRLAALFLLLALLPLTATAEDPPQCVTDFVTKYNSYADTFVVPPLPLDGWTYKDVYYSLSLDDATLSSISITDGLKPLVMLVMPPEDVNGDFFAVCACISCALRGDLLENFSDIMTAYFALRNVTQRERITHRTDRGTVFFEYDDDFVFFGVTN